MKKITLAVLLAFAVIVTISTPSYGGELHDAVLAKDPAKVRQLLELGANVNVPGEYQRTPLHFAAGYSTIAVAALLIEKGADVNARDNHQYTPLHFAAESGKADIAKLLIEKGADVNARTEYKSTPLHRAAGQGITEVAALLIQKGVDVNARDWVQDTPLHVAAEYGDGGSAGEGNAAELVKLLIEKGADVNARNGAGSTPLHRAAGGYSSTSKLAAVLIEKGADLNARDHYGDTPAMIAEKSKKLDLIAMLRRPGSGSAQQDFNAKLQTVAKAGYATHDDIETIVRLARSLASPPIVPQEAQEAMTYGKAAYKLARRPEDLKEAEDHFRKATLLAPWLPEPYFNLAAAQEKQYKWDDARASFEKYLIAAPDARDAEAVKQKMAELKIQKKRQEDFEQEVNIGVVLYEKGPSEYNEAILHWKKAVELCPEHQRIDQVYYNLGEAYMNKGNLDDAYKYMQKSLEVNPNTDSTARYTNMGVVLERRGDRARACTHYKKGCDLGSKVSCRNYSNACP